MKKTRNAPVEPIETEAPPVRGGRKLRVSVDGALNIAEKGARFLRDVAALGKDGATPAEIDAVIRDGEALIASIRAAFRKV